MVPEHPPTEPPAIALTLDYRDEPDHQILPNAEVRDGRLLLRNDAVQMPAGAPLSDRSFRDVLIDARITLLKGGDDSVYGVYARQADGTQYVAWGMTPAGRVLAGIVLDNQWNTTAEADLAPDLPFNRGLGQPNRFQVLAFGPCIVYVLNGAIVTAQNVDQRFKEGFAGYFLLRGQASPNGAVLAVDWAQVRGVLPGQATEPRS